MIKLFKLRQHRVATLVRKANAARDNGNPAAAAALYGDAVRIARNRPDLYVQQGNMLKDSGNFAAAATAYAQGHNGFAALARKRGAEWAASQIADVYMQLGHLYKKAGRADFSIHFYRRSNALKPFPGLAEEMKFAALTIHGVPETAAAVAYPDLDELPFAADLGKIGTALPGDTIDQALVPGYQCVCWSSDHFIDAGQDDAAVKYITCGICGSVYSQATVRMNMTGQTTLIPLTKVSLDQIETLLGNWPGHREGGRIGLVGAELAEAKSGASGRIETIPAFNSRLQPGLERCSFDCIVIWSVSNQFSDMRRVIDQAFQALRPNGTLVIGYSPISAVPMVMQNLRKSVVSLKDDAVVIEPASGGAAHQSGARTEQEKPSGVQPLFLLSDFALRSLIEPVRRDARVLPNRFALSPLHSFVAARKTGVLSVGIMSGIGDAVWSFVIDRAVRRKYGADALLYHVNDSGDARRKRSNNMLARFGFVNDMVSSVFQIHADTPMDDKSGHLNYLPSGPVLVDSRDEFDYRLIVNTYLEHGHGFDRICEDLALEPADLDFDFFKDYDEQDVDSVAVDKVRNFVGSDYAIFYYGAEVDNTIGGLNRDEIWRPDDWNRLGRMIHDEYGLKLVVIGAPYDTSYANKILNRNEDNFYYNAIGELDITETLALIQRSKFVVAFPAGVGIVGPYMRVPTVIFWRPKHQSYHVMHDRAGFDPSFATNWVPQPVLDSGTYYPAWYGTDTPETIMGAIRKGGWAKRKITTPIGNWKD